MLDYQDCLDRLYYTTTTNASGITRKQAYDKLRELIDFYYIANEEAEQWENAMKKVTEEKEEQLKLFED